MKEIEVDLSHCWVPLLGAIAGRHNKVPLLGGKGAMGFHCWMFWWGDIAGCHGWVLTLADLQCHGNATVGCHCWAPECYTVLRYTFLYIDNTKIGLCYLGSMLV